MPALLNSASSRPHCVLAVAKALSTDAVSPTSHGRISARSFPPAVASSVSCRRPISPNLPASTPKGGGGGAMPLPAPVMMIVLSMLPLIPSANIPIIGKSPLAVHQSGGKRVPRADFCFPAGDSHCKSRHHRQTEGLIFGNQYRLCDTS